MMVVMDWRIPFSLYVRFFIIHCACSSTLSAPQSVKVKSSVLTWSAPRNKTNVSYTVQNYSLKQNNWSDVYHGTQEQFNFTANAEDFYGSRFRVRSERENQKSDWVMTEPVLCAYLHTCAPVIELKVDADKVHLWMKHRDRSPPEKEGAHIRFKALYWKRDSANDIQEPVINSDHLVLKHLEPAQNYCFQAEYMLFHKPHGMPSPIKCEVIPETPNQRNVRVILLGVLIVAGFAILGTSLYYLYTHFRRIKQLLLPPLDIPDHFQEFFFSDFSRHPVDRPGNNAVESFECLSFLEELPENNGQPNLDHSEERASSK